MLSYVLSCLVPRVSLPTELFVYEDDGNVYVCVTLESTFTTVTNITVIMSTTDGTGMQHRGDSVCKLCSVSFFGRFGVSLIGGFIVPELSG